MKHPREIELERYAIESPLLTVELRQKLQEHVSLCSYCRDVYTALREVHSEARRRTLEEPSDQLKEWIATVDPTIRSAKFILRLHPAAYSISITQDKPNMIVLAAQDTKILPRYTAVQTLTTTDESTFIKILRDNEQDSFRAQIISDQPQFIDQVIVSFDSIEELFFTNHKGEFQFGNRASLNFKNLHATIHLPESIVELHVADIQNILSQNRLQIADANGIPVSIEHRAAHDDLLITMEGYESNERKALVFMDGKGTIIQITDSSFSVPISIIQNGGIIKIF